MDYYKLLGLSKNATAAEIKKSYRALAKKYHPDKTQEDESDSKKFKEINEAYQILSDTSKRKKYDRDLEGSHNSFDPFSGVGDLFEEFFKGSYTAGRRERNPGQTSVSFNIPISDLKTGNTLNATFRLKNNLMCSSCHGVGGEFREKCNDCGGTGKITSVIQKGAVIFQSTTSCNKCYGSGHIITNPCRKCKSAGVIQEDEVYDVKIKARLRKS